MTRKDRLQNFSRGTSETRSEPSRCWENRLRPAVLLVGDTGIEPVTSFVSEIGNPVCSVGREVRRPAAGGSGLVRCGRLLYLAAVLQQRRRRSVRQCHRRWPEADGLRLHRRGELGRERPAFADGDASLRHRLPLRLLSSRDFAAGRRSVPPLCGCQRSPTPSPRPRSQPPTGRPSMSLCPSRWIPREPASPCRSGMASPTSIQPCTSTGGLRPTRIDAASSPDAATMLPCRTRYAYAPRSSSSMTISQSARLNRRTNPCRTSCRFSSFPVGAVWWPVVRHRRAAGGASRSAGVQGEWPWPPEAGAGS